MRLHNRTALSGVASVPLTLSKQLGGTRKAPLPFARAARPEGGGLIDKKGETLVSPFLPARAAQAQIPPTWEVSTHRARDARPYGFGGAGLFVRSKI